MASIPHGGLKIIRNRSIPFAKIGICLVSISSLPQNKPTATQSSINERAVLNRLSTFRSSTVSSKGIFGLISKKVILTIPRSNSSSNSNGTEDAPSYKTKTRLGYSRKDVILIGLGVFVAGIGLKSRLEAGNVVPLVLVLGLTIGCFCTYTYGLWYKAMTLPRHHCEIIVMEKRLRELEELLEQLEAKKRRIGRKKKGLLEQLEEKKRRIASGDQLKR